MNTSPRHFGLALSLAVSVTLIAACGGQAGVESVEVGQDVALTKTDGGVVEGKVASVDDKNLHVTSGRTTRAIPKDQVADVQVVDNAKPVELPAAAKFREYTIPEGTTLSLRLTNSISSATSRVEDAVEASLVEDVVVNGVDVLPSGSTVKGFVSSVQSPGKVKGLASLAVHFRTVEPAGRNDRYNIDATYSRTAEPTKAEDAKKIGIGAGAGAAIGGLLGGKGGAAKGAAIGGGAGTAVVLSTEGDDVVRPAGALLTVRLNKSVEVRVPVKSGQTT